MSKKVYVVLEEYCKDYETSIGVSVFSTYEKAIQGIKNVYTDNVKETFVKDIEEERIYYVDPNGELENGYETYYDYVDNTSYDKNGDMVSWSFYKIGEYCNTHIELNILEKTID